MTTVWRAVADLIPILIALGVSLWLIRYVCMDPISRFARGAFRMKLDRKTDIFWAKSRGSLSPPAACGDCAVLNCTLKRGRPGWTVVDCPEHITEDEAEERYGGST